MRRPATVIEDFYGAGPRHLLALAVCFAVTGYTITRILSFPQWPWMLVWFIGAVIGHDLVAFPVYAGADRALVRGLGALRRSRTGTPPPVPAVNHIRLPAMGAGLLFVLFFPVITQQVRQDYVAASGRTPDDYLERWLLISAAMFATSAVVYALRLAHARHRRHLTRR